MHPRQRVVAIHGRSVSRRADQKDVHENHANPQVATSTGHQAEATCLWANSLKEPTRPRLVFREPLESLVGNPSGAFQL